MGVNVNEQIQRYSLFGLCFSFMRDGHLNEFTGSWVYIIVMFMCKFLHS